jgi:hypothetical protein
VTSRRVIDVHGVAVMPRPRPQRFDPGPDPAGYSRGLSRRREAAHRAEPLPGMPADGALVSVDPLAHPVEPDGESAAVLVDVLVLEVEGHTAWALGVPNYRVRSLLDRLGVPRQFDVKRRVWTCPARRAHEVARAARFRGLEAVVVAKGEEP